jgi:hypothetical protein
MHGDLLGRIYADPHLVAFDAKHGNLNIVSNVEGFANASSKYQHCSALLSVLPDSITFPSLCPVTHPWLDRLLNRFCRASP